MSEDKVSTEDLVNALLAPSGEIIEDYPDDARGHSCLLLTWLSEDQPLHICCAEHEETLVIITVYRPSPHLWTPDWRRRR